MRKQLREFYTPEQLQAVYVAPYVHTKWKDHIARVARTIELGTELCQRIDAQVGADFTAGDGAILRGLPLADKIYGDWRVAPGMPTDEHWMAADVEDEFTWRGFGWVADRPADNVDVFVCSETLEHVRDPDLLLRRIRHVSAALVLSTPVGEVDAGNPEHYWGWDVEGVEEMLAEAGWSERECETLSSTVVGAYTYQIWRCT